MAFTAGGSATGGQLIATVVAPGFVDAVWRNNLLMQHFPAPIANPGDTARRWKVARGASTAVGIYVEGDSALAADSQKWATAAVSYTYFQGTVQISGHARDAMVANYVDGIALEITNLQEDIKDLMTTSFLGSTYGLLNAVAATGTYAGLARGAITYWESQVTTLNRTLAYSDLQDLYEGARDNEHAANPTCWLTSWNQNTNIYNVNGQPAMKIVSDGNPAPGYLNQVVFGCPVLPMPDFDDNTILLCDMSPGNWEVVARRPFQMVNLGPSGDSDVYLITTASSGPICRNPIRQSKLASVTA